MSGHTGAFGSVTLPCLGRGPAVDLSRLGGGRPVLVNLWASWCLPCQREMPRLQRAYRQYGDRVWFLGIDTEDSAGSARSFLAAVRATYAQVVDEDGMVRIHLRSVGLPVTVVIGADGAVVYRRVGEMRPADLQRALSAAGVA